MENERLHGLTIGNIDVLLYYLRPNWEDVGLIDIRRMWQDTKPSFSLAWPAGAPGSHKSLS